MSGISDPTPIILYTTPNGAVRVEVMIRNETVWLSQKALAELFGVSVSSISRHLKNIYDTGELGRAATVAEFARVRPEGDRSVQRAVESYNLDAIIAVGYRVNSHQATQFRIWATKTLREFIIKGFVMDDARLKAGKHLFGKDYFDELLERIREIRASERRFYQKITDLYALASDYSSEAPQSREFFAAVQHTLHWAITGKTAAELIHESADATKPAMGLTTWKQAPHGKVLKSDVAVAKNYLNAAHVAELNRLVSAYLDLAESRAQRGLVTTMAEWASFLNRYLELANYPILADKGKVSMLEAKLKAESEFEVFRQRQDQDYVSDFDREIKRLEGKKRATDGDAQGSSGDTP